MTREEAIKWLKAIDEKYIHGGDEEYDALRKETIDMAIRSLEAWDKVLHEIGSIGLGWEYGQGVGDCYNIINKHMKEVEEWKKN